MGADWCRPMTRGWLYALAALGLSACGPPQTAMDTFQQKYFCPSAIVTTAERDSVAHGDIAAHTLAFARIPDSVEWVNWGGLMRGSRRPVPNWKEQLKRCGVTPPAKIAADPERLAVWNAREAKLWAVYDSGFSPVVEVVGCGKRVWYVWAWKYTSRQGRQYPVLIVLKDEAERF